MPERIYAAIDLKSFYASAECVQRGLDPLTTNLVVADESRTEKTICLAVSPSLKAYGIAGRARLFEVVQKTREVNALRRQKNGGRELTGASYHDPALKENPALALSYLVAPPQMAKYMDLSRQIYEIYLNFIAPEDIHVYSIDEVFLDLTAYLKVYRLSARDLTMRMIREVLAATGITATAGIGTNLYLAKIAMDIEAKHCRPDADGVRIAMLDEQSYRQRLWTHRPLTDFWRIGRGYATRLEKHGLYTMGDVARTSRSRAGEDLLYKLFGVNAELLIDHAWGWEPCTMQDIKAYRPSTSSLSTGQVLPCPYPFDKARLIVREMAEARALALVEKGLVTDQLELTVGYDTESLTRPFSGEVTTDHYGRKIPKNAHGTENLGQSTASTRQLLAAALALFDRIVDPALLVRRIWLTANHITQETACAHAPAQLDLFADPAEADARKRERRAQEAIVHIKKKYGKNAILKGTNLREGATAVERNRQIGGHKA